MKNLILGIGICFGMLLLTSCDYEYLEIEDHGGCPPLDNTFESSYVSTLDIIAAEKAALQRNWEKDNHMYFKNPFEYEGNVIYGDRDLHSVDLSTGKTNWTTDVGYASFEKAIKYQDVLYLIASDEIFGVNLDSGELVFEYKWPGHENLHNQILIDNEVMYVSVNDCDHTYSSFAYCPMNSIRSGQWVYFNKRIAAESPAGYTSIGGKAIVENAKQEKLIVAITAEGSIYEPGRKPEILEAFNLNTNVVEWKLQEGIGEDLGGKLLGYKDQLIIRGSDFVMGINFATGEEVWRSRASYMEFVSTEGMYIYENMLFLIGDDDVATAYNLDNDGAKIWRANSSIGYEQYNDGIEQSSFNIVEDKLYYLSSWGFLIDIDITTGEFTRHHEELPFDSGMFITQEKDCLTLPQYDRQLVSFALE